MSKHSGEHPRMGATDVCPLVPIANIDMQECVKWAHKLGERVGRELAIPVYHYEAALHDYAKSNASDLLDTINTSGDFSDEIETAMKKLCDDFANKGAY